MSIISELVRMWKARRGRVLEAEAEERRVETELKPLADPSRRGFETDKLIELMAGLDSVVGLGPAGINVSEHVVELWSWPLTDQETKEAREKMAANQKAFWGF